MSPLKIARRWFGPLALALASLSVASGHPPAHSSGASVASGASGASGASVALGTSGTSGQQPTQPAPKVAEAETAIARLVPADALCIIQVPSLDALATAIRSVMRAVSPENQEAPEIDALLSGILMIPGDIALIDHKKPLAMCFSLDPEVFEPVPTFILPVTSLDAYLKSLPQPDDTPSADGMPKPPAPAKPVSLNGYVGVTELAKYAAAEAPRSLAASLPPGVVSTRIDLERLFEITRPMIEPMLEQGQEAMAAASGAAVPGMDTSALAKSYMDGFRTFMDSAETLDIAAAMQGDRVDLSLAFTALEKSALAEFGSKEKTAVESLAKYLDPEASFSMLLGMDMASIMKKLEPLIGSTMALYPEPMRASFTASMASFTELYPLFGSGLALNFDFGAAGMRGACYFQPKDAKALLEQYTKCFKELKMPGVDMQGPEPITVDGIALSQFHVTVDAKAMTDMAGDKADPAMSAQLDTMMKKIYGEKGLRIAYGMHDSRMVQVVGGDDAYLKRALAALKDGGRKISGDLEPRVQQISSMNPCFLWRVDVARFFTEVMQLGLGAPPEEKTGDKAKPAPAAPMTFYGGVDGRVWRGGATWDLARVASAMKESFNASAIPGQVASVVRSKVRADILSINDALMQYTILNDGKYPDSLVVLITPDANGKAFLAGNKVPLDPWGREYHYQPPADGNPNARIYTYGKDGKPGGTGEDADIDDAIMFSDEGK